MNTVQQPASEVATTLLIPEGAYQRTSGLRSFSNSLNSILTPIIASAVYALWGIGVIVAIDLTTFAVAFAALWLLIPIPEEERRASKAEPLTRAARQGLQWLRENPLILQLILFLAAINLVASAHSATLPAMLLSRAKGGETVLGLVNSCSGVATLLGSLAVTVLPAPRDRVRTICLTLLLSMSTENFLLAFGRTPIVWYLGAILGWIAIPVMSANLDVIFRRTIPTEMQGRVYACRNTLQFFTIPVGYFLGGSLVDAVFEPLTARADARSALTALFGSGKGSGAACLFAVLGVAGVLVCLIFTLLLRRYRWSEDPR